MDTAEILKRVRRIEIETGKLVKETFAGEYLSIFKGQGVVSFPAISPQYR